MRYFVHRALSLSLSRRICIAIIFWLLLVKILEYAVRREESFNVIGKITICLVEIYLELEYFAIVEISHNF